MRRTDGSELWRQNLLHRRGLSAPAIDGGSVVVADYQGYVHWIDRSDGAIIGRVQAGSERVAKPIVVNGVVLVQDASLFGMVVERGRSLVIAINKWDKLTIEQRDNVRRELELTRLLEHAVITHQPPLVRGRRIKLRYAPQGGRNPPIIIVQGYQTQHVPDAYRRYLENIFRITYDLVGAPVRVDFRTDDNPYAVKRRVSRPRPRRSHSRSRSHSRK